MMPSNKSSTLHSFLKLILRFIICILNILHKLLYIFLVVEVYFYLMKEYVNSMNNEFPTISTAVFNIITYFENIFIYTLIYGWR